MDRHRPQQAMRALGWSGDVVVTGLQPPGCTDGRSASSTSVQLAFSPEMPGTSAPGPGQSFLRDADCLLQDLVVGVHVHRALFINEAGEMEEKLTKTHQQRCIALDDEAVEVVRDLVWRYEKAARDLGIERVPDPYLFSLSPDGSTPMRPGLPTERFGKIAKKLGLKCDLKSLRHFSANELIVAGVDVRTVAGRLGHGSGGATTLRRTRPGSARLDQRAAATLSGRMPARPKRT
jgi:hypothetical protein